MTQKAQGEEKERLDDKAAAEVHPPKVAAAVAIPGEAAPIGATMTPEPRLDTIAEGRKKAREAYETWKREKAEKEAQEKIEREREARQRELEERLERRSREGLGR